MLFIGKFTKLIRPKYSPPHIPLPTGRRFAIGDVHGCFYSLKMLVETQLEVNQNDQLFLLGDYINRGKHSAKVLDYLLELKKNDYQVYALRGNHEQKFLQAYSCGLEFFEGFLEEYNSLDLLNENTEQYLDFCTSLEYCLFSPGFFLSHCGIQPNSQKPATDVRGMFQEVDIMADEKITENCIIIQGHNTASIQQIETSIQTKSRRINLDGGCVYSRYLCALNLDTFELFKQTNIG